MNTNQLKSGAKEGLRIGLLVFLICFAVSILLSTIGHFLWLDDLNQIINGSLSVAPQVSLWRIMQGAGFVMNIIVFSTANTPLDASGIHVGLLILGILPWLVFFIVERMRVKNKEMSIEIVVQALASAMVYSGILAAFSWITHGDYLGMHLNFASILNLFMGIVVLFIMHLSVYVNPKEIQWVGVRYALFALAIFIGLGLIVGFIGVLILGIRYTGHVLMAFIAALVLAPNLGVYALYTFMGGSLTFGDQLITLMNNFGISLDFTTLPIAVRFAFLILFITILFTIIWRMKEGMYWFQLPVFAMTFSMISVVGAYITSINLGAVKDLLEIEFGFSLLFAFAVPFIISMVLGILVYLIRYVIGELAK